MAWGCGAEPTPKWPNLRHKPNILQAPQEIGKKKMGTVLPHAAQARTALAPPAPGAPQADWRDAGGRPERRGAIDIASRNTRPIKTSTMQTGL